MPDEPDIAARRRACAAQGLHSSSLPLGVDLQNWLARAPTTWDAFADTTVAKSDAESCGMAEVLRYPNVRLVTGTRIDRLLASADADHHAALAYRSDLVGRNFMKHSRNERIAVNPLRRNRIVHDQTIQFNDGYQAGGPQGAPMGNVRMLACVTGRHLHDRGA